LGNGADEQIRGIDNEIAAVEALMEVNKKSASRDAQYEAEQSARLNQLKKQRADLVFSQERELQAAKNKTQEMEIQQKGDSVALRQAQIKADFEERIAKAKHDQNDALVEQLEKQKKLSLHQLETEEYLKTPEQRAQERDEKRKEDRADSTVTAREKMREHNKKANDNGFDAAFGPGKTLGQASKHAMFGGGTALDKKPGVGQSKAQYSPGVTGAANDTMVIKQMTVETMTVTNLNVQNFELKNK
jgi:hypothetical protein